jgi:hypothetical protein
MDFVYASIIQEFFGLHLQKNVSFARLDGQYTILDLEMEVVI